MAVSLDKQQTGQKTAAKKNSGAWKWVVGILILLSLVTDMMPEDTDFIIGLLAFAVIAAVLIVVILKASKTAKNGTMKVKLPAFMTETQPDSQKHLRPAAWIGSEKEDHSHDRLTASHAPEDPFEHWKIQVDGFYRAGLIDRKEYNTLLERHMDLK